MRRGRITLIVAGMMAATTLGGATGAFAASPQDICADLADGRLDGTYTAAELTSFLQDPTVQGYGCSSPVVTPTVTPTPPQTPAGAPTPAETPAATPAAQPQTSGVAGQQATILPAPAFVAPAAAPAPTTGVAGQQKTLKGRPAAVAPAKAAAVLGTSKTTGTLPFTGAELALFLIVGLALIGAGFLLRLTARQRPTRP